MAPVKLEHVLLLVLHCAHLLVKLGHGHGRMLEPPARNTLWRFGFKAPANYNDNELFCGGIGGITRNRGKCGVCGDSYDGTRFHETGNQMALNQTTRNYFPGSSIDLLIEIVANHGGLFSFGMCWRNGWQTKETEDCFELLELDVQQTINSSDVDGPPPSQDKPQQQPATFFELDSSAGTGIYTMSLRLPHNRTCDNCVLRWHWESANNWGVCDDGTERIGCGYQEVYRNCADISIRRDGAGIGSWFQ